MKSYLIMSSDAFENLQFSSILILLDILFQAGRVNKSSYIKRLFSEKTEGYAETVACITGIGMGKQVNENLQLSVDWVLGDESQRRMIVLQNILKARSRYRSDILRFIEKFRVMDGEIVYFPSDQSRSSESAVRNFLMEMKVVAYARSVSKYLLMSEYTNLYIDARDEVGHTSPSALILSLSAKNDIGFAAEREIFLYERNRVGPSYADKVEHISLKNVAAGYDIQSITLKGDATVTALFIEVKAVPGRSYRFYWSRNEVKTAQRLSEWYRLYLLPFDKHGKFDITKLKIIADPYNALRAKETAWICETDTLIYSLKPTTPS